jgi:hypothetical protein
MPIESRVVLWLRRRRHGNRPLLAFVNGRPARAAFIEDGTPGQLFLVDPRGRKHVVRERDSFPAFLSKLMPGKWKVRIVTPTSEVLERSFFVDENEDRIYLLVAMYERWFPGLSPRKGSTLKQYVYSGWID